MSLEEKLKEVAEEIKKPLTPEEIKAQKLARMAVEKFYMIEPDASNVLYKIARFAELDPKNYKNIKNMLDSELKKLLKK